MAPLIARGKYLWEGDRKFYAKGVSYGTFAPNSRGEQYPEPQCAADDFALMRELGVNVIRTYVPPPPWIYELAARNSLRLMVGIPWAQHMTFLDSPVMVREIRATVRKMVSEIREFRDAIFACTLGNEIRSDIVRWHGPRQVSRFVAELYDIAKGIDPDTLFTYANYPSVEYLDLSFLDLLCFNVYLHQEPDFRRYMTHLLALAADRPLILSETGMDTIREGEAHQAQLLDWQARAAFELGLSGFIIFAFTDEWYTGGAEITDWAFGVVTRNRQHKQAFGAVAGVFNQPIPPALSAPPKASIVVAAYNAAATIGACLDSLRRLDYPNFEVIVVDDGSTDASGERAAAAGVKLLRSEHQGLAAARNLGIEAADGEIVAFIDADAMAEPDWLYHLIETITRRGAAAAGGPNFPPPARSDTMAAIAQAPGQPREVRASEDSLAQLCGCNMAIVRAQLGALGGFDPVFTAAGDDVDLSWRLQEIGALIAYAPGAVVTHERRGCVSAYLQQQIGYGEGEALLARKYPERGGTRIYGDSRWQARWLGWPRIYYGAMGRGLFQTIYPAGTSQPLIELPLSAPWIGGAVLLMILGAADGLYGALGAGGLLLSIAVAAWYAVRTPIPHSRSKLRTTAVVAVLALAGTALRSGARLLGYFKGRVFPPIEAAADTRLRIAGVLTLALGPDHGPAKLGRDTMTEALRYALFRRGLVVASNTGFEPFDMQILLGPVCRVPLNILWADSGKLALRWRLAANPTAVVVGAVLILLALASGRWALTAVAAAAVLASLAAVTIPPLRRLPAILKAAALEATTRLGIHAEVVS